MAPNLIDGIIMKKCILLNLLLILISLLSLNAQTSHLTFKDIPIDGKASLFVKKMEQQGFTLTEQEVGQTVMEGKFVNEICEVYIVSTPKTDIVWKIVVLLPKQKSWISLKSDYLNYSNQFKTKYGKPTDSFDFFSKPYQEGDGYELQALENDKCHYLSFFERTNGSISVRISKSASIRFDYEDEINSKKDTVERDSQVQDDI